MGARNRSARRLLPGLALLAAVAGLAWIALAPKPVAVEGAPAVRGPLEVTVDQEAEVRVHDRYVVAAPVAGKLVRVALHDGDAVKAGDIVATLEPAPLDARAREEAVARLDAARALVREAEHNVAHAAADLEQAKRERARVEKLVAERFVSPEAAEKVHTAEATAIAALAAARARVAASASEARVAAAALLALPSAEGRSGRLVNLVAPVSGRVFRVLEKSERTVSAGTPVMTIGDPARFEIVADVLSTDAVKIKPGAPVRLEEWGGDRPLEARVRLVEPYAFTKISALGVEEQRVNVVMDPVDPIGPLGDGYRVEARIIVWSADPVLKVPGSALFRAKGGWRVFVVAGDRARSRPVEVGERNPFEAEIRAGLAEGEKVIKYPGTDVTDGVRVVLR